MPIVVLKIKREKIALVETGQDVFGKNVENAFPIKWYVHADSKQNASGGTRN